LRDCVFRKKKIKRKEGERERKCRRGKCAERESVRRRGGEVMGIKKRRRERKKGDSFVNQERSHKTLRKVSPLPSPLLQVKTSLTSLYWVGI